MAIRFEKKGPHHMAGCATFSTAMPVSAICVPRLPYDRYWRARDWLVDAQKPLAARRYCCGDFPVEVLARVRRLRVDYVLWIFLHHDTEGTGARQCITGMGHKLYQWIGD